MWKKVTWHTTKYGDPYSEFVLCIYPILSAHTPWTHTRSSGQPFMLRRPGSSPGSILNTSVVVLRIERVLYIHSPHRQFLPARDSNSQPLDYESDSLTIRPRIPLSSNESDFYGLDLVNNNLAQKQIIVESCTGGGRFSENNRRKSYGFWTTQGWLIVFVWMIPFKCTFCFLHSSYY